MKKIVFEAGTSRYTGEGVNLLASTDGTIYAECTVPGGVSEDYGYLTLKAAIIRAYTAAGRNPEELEFWYDGQEEYLEEDASADCDVRIDLE